MHKKFNPLRISGLSDFLNGARLTCYAKAPDRRTSVNRSPGMDLRVPGSVGVARAASGEPESGGPGTGIAARRRWRNHGPGLVPSPARRVREACAPPCSSAKGRRSLPARERRSGTGLRSSFAGASRGATAPGLSRASEAVPEAPSGGSGGLNGRGPRDLSPARPVLQAPAVGFAFGFAVSPASGAGAEGFGCRFARARRAGTRSRKGPPVLSRSAPDR